MSVITASLQNKKVLLLDSAMGSELHKRGINVNLPLWSARAICDNPDTVRLIHIENVDAGADIISTNTFRTQRRSFEKAGFQYEGKSFKDTAFEMTKLACELAMEAKMITHDNVLIAGVIAPLEDSYKPEYAPDIKTIEKEQSEHIENLLESGVDLLLAETLSNVNEIRVLTELLDETDTDYMLSLIMKDAETLLSGDKIDMVIDTINNSKASALLFNCMSPDLITGTVQKLSTKSKLLMGAYANVGDPSANGSENLVSPVISRDDYLAYAKTWYNYGLKIFGGCCGTDPSYIKVLCKLK